MIRQTADDIRKANEAVSRPEDRTPAARHGKILAGQRYELALNPLGDEGSEPSETEQAARRASRNAERP